MMTGRPPVCRVDCTEEHAPDSYFQSAETRVVQSPIGNYREAAGTKEARFAYRFRIRSAGPVRRVTEQPGGKRLPFGFERGVLTVTLPRVEIHTCLVIDGWARPDGR
ncbi:MAG TPA: hypothetical protein VM389_01675 [Phycisphaerae bacterium]|nr:hypothetical protein [Phycisphaerae bacterium]